MKEYANYFTIFTHFFVFYPVFLVSLRISSYLFMDLYLSARPTIFAVDNR